MGHWLRCVRGHLPFLPHTSPGASDHRLAALTDDSPVTCGRRDDPFNITFDIVLRSPYAADSLTHKYRQPHCVGHEDADNSCNDDGDH